MLISIKTEEYHFFLFLIYKHKIYKNPLSTFKGAEKEMLMLNGNNSLLLNSKPSQISIRSDNSTKSVYENALSNENLRLIADVSPPSPPTITADTETINNKPTFTTLTNVVQATTSPIIGEIQSPASVEISSDINNNNTTAILVSAVANNNDITITPVLGVNNNNTISSSKSSCEQILLSRDEGGEEKNEHSLAEISNELTAAAAAIGSGGTGTSETIVGVYKSHQLPSPPPPPPPPQQQPTMPRNSNSFNNLIKLDIRPIPEVIIPTVVNRSQASLMRANRKSIKEESMCCSNPGYTVATMDRYVDNSIV
jgi:hypothetical protein